MDHLTQSVSLARKDMLSTDPVGDVDITQSAMGPVGEQSSWSNGSVSVCRSRAPCLMDLGPSVCFKFLWTANYVSLDLCSWIYIPALWVQPFFVAYNRPIKREFQTPFPLRATRNRADWKIDEFLFHPKMPCCSSAVLSPCCLFDISKQTLCLALIHT